MWGGVGLVLLHGCMLFGLSVYNVYINVRYIIMSWSIFIRVNYIDCNKRCASFL